MFLNSRERVLTAIGHREPDRVPIDFGGYCNRIHVEAHKALKNFLGFRGGETKIVNTMEQTVRPDERILKRFGVDIYTIYPIFVKEPEIRERADGYYLTDEFGCVLKKPKKGGYYFDFVKYPLENANFEDLKEFELPDPKKLVKWDDMEKEVKSIYEKTNYAVSLGRITGGVFETSQWLRGMSKFLMDLIVNKKFAKALLNKVFEFDILYLSEALDRVGDYVQLVSESDDLGSESGPLINPKLYREMIKPIHEKIFDFIKRKADVYINFHSCGSVYEFIPDFIETGIDILNPIQVSAKNMDTKKLKEEFGEKLTFIGGFDTQRVLPHGSTADVKREAKKRIFDSASGGGFIFSTVHNIQPDVPPENIVTMFDTVREYGKYPIIPP